MISEHVYNAAFRLTRKTKKIFLAKAVEREEMKHFKSIGTDDWDPYDRKAEYREKVKPYWKKFGGAPKRFWFEMFGSRDHRMDPRFLPADMFYTELLPYMNNGLMRSGLMNKAYLDFLFSDVKQPPTVAVKIEGIYCDDKRKLISEGDAIALCRERGGELFLKVSSGTSSGRGIYVLTPSDCSDAEIRKIFDEAGGSFIIQERIRQHPVMDGLNPSSVSTIRVLSLLLEDKVYVESAGLRVSAPGLPFVTVYDGGFYAEILKDGKLFPKVYSDIGEWFDDGKGVFDYSFRIPNIEGVYDEVRRIHPRMGHFKCIGWDFAIGENGDPVMLEYNVFPGLGCPQIARCKPVFNERTDWILEDYFSRRKWAKNHRQDILIQ